MSEKQPRNYKITKLRIILLYEVDFTQLNIYWQRNDAPSRITGVGCWQAIQ